MNILFLDPIKLRNTDGCGIHRIELIKNFTVMGNEVYIFLKGNPEVDFEFIPGLVNVHSFQIGSNKLKSLFVYIYYLSVLSLKNQIDLFYSRNVIYTLLGFIPAKVKKSKIFFEKNGIISDEATSYNIDTDKKQQKRKQNTNIFFFLEKLELLTIKHCDNVIAVTPLLKKYLVENGVEDKKVHVIENGANTDLFKPMPKDIARKSLNLLDERNYVCFVGNLAPWQGLKVLIQALPLVIKEIPINLLIVGDGPLYKELITLSKELGVEKYIVFTGRMPYEKVPLYINASDVCVAPFIKSRNDKIGLSPLKIYEYMSCNKPVICSRIPNLDFVEKQNAGILFEPENVNELAKSIISFFDDKQKYETLSSRDYIINNNSWLGIAKRILLLSE